MRVHTLLSVLAAATLLAAGAAPAQQTEAPAAPSATAPAGPRPGAGPRGPMHPRVGPGYTPGWSMMTPEERDEHRQRMFSSGSPEECRKLFQEHRDLMMERARERGLAAPRGPRRDPCANVRG